MLTITPRASRLAEALERIFESPRVAPGEGNAWSFCDNASPPVFSDAVAFDSRRA